MNWINSQLDRTVQEGRELGKKKRGGCWLGMGWWLTVEPINRFNNSGIADNTGVWMHAVVWTKVPTACYMHKIQFDLSTSTTPPPPHNL